jgi:hypothetical protein
MIRVLVRACPAELAPSFLQRHGIRVSGLRLEPADEDLRTVATDHQLRQFRL